MGAEGIGCVSSAIPVIASVVKVNACFVASANANLSLAPRNGSAIGAVSSALLGL